MAITGAVAIAFSYFTSRTCNGIIRLQVKERNTQRCEGENMKHYYKLDGNTIGITMGCNHPNMKNNSIGCDGNCSTCPFSIASCSIPTMKALLEKVNAKQC